MDSISKKFSVTSIELVDGYPLSVRYHLEDKYIFIDALDNQPVYRLKQQTLALIKQQIKKQIDGSAYL